MPLIALSGALLGGALGSVLPGHAYNVTLETTGTATVGRSFQEYEANVLARVAALSGREKVPDQARGTITVNQDGVVVAVDVTGTPGAAMVRKLKAARFAKIPSLESSGTIKLDFSIAELASPPYSREAVAMRGDDLVMSNEKPAAIAATRTHLISSSQALPVPYSEADRNFDREIVSLYKQLPSFVLEARRHRRSNDVSEEQLQMELLRCRKQKNWPGACNILLIMLKAPVEKSKLGRVKEWLEILEDMSGKLDEGGKRTVILALIELAAHCSHRPESVVGRELLLRQAEVLLNRDSNDEASIHLTLSKELASHYQRARNQEQERKANLNVLKYTQAVNPVDTRAAVRAYQTVLGDRISAGDQSAARETLDEYRVFVEKRLGSESLELIPVIVSSLQVETDEENRNASIASIAKLVDAYRPTPVFDILGDRRDESERNAVTSLQMLKEAEAKREKASIERAEARLAGFEKATIDPLQLLDSRLSLIRLYRGRDEKKIVSQLEKMSQDLRRAPAEATRPGLDVHLILSLRGEHALNSDRVFEKPLVYLFRTLNERLPGGISPQAMQMLRFPRFRSTSASNFDAVLNALGVRESSAGQ